MSDKKDIHAELSDEFEEDWSEEDFSVESLENEDFSEQESDVIEHVKKKSSLLPLILLTGVSAVVLGGGYFAYKNNLLPISNTSPENVASEVVAEDTQTDQSSASDAQSADETLVGSQSPVTEDATGESVSSVNTIENVTTQETNSLNDSGALTPLPTATDLANVDLETLDQPEVDINSELSQEMPVLSEGVENAPEDVENVPEVVANVPEGVENVSEGVENAPEAMPNLDESVLSDKLQAVPDDSNEPVDAEVSHVEENSADTQILNIGQDPTVDSEAAVKNDALPQIPAIEDTNDVNKSADNNLPVTENVVPEKPSVNSVPDGELNISSEAEMAGEEVKGDVTPTTDKILDKVSKQDNEQEVKATVEPVKPQAAVVKKDSASTEAKAISKPVIPVKWTLKSAQTGKAVLYNSATDQTVLVEVGNNVQGLGRVKSIEKINGRWLVSGTSGSVSQ